MIGVTSFVLGMLKVRVLPGKRLVVQQYFSSLKNERGVGKKKRKLRSV